MNTCRPICCFVLNLCLLSACGCSSLGLSLLPYGATLSTEAERVLDSSPIPEGIARENLKTVLASHAIQPGDAILIEFNSVDSDMRIPPDQVVLADGTVDLGPYGRIVLAGRSLEQAEAIVEQQIIYMGRTQQQLALPKVDNGSDDNSSNGNDIAANNDIGVNIRLLEPVHRFYVLGEVNSPGSFPLAGYETVLDAIVAAGGLTNSANPCKVLLARPTDPSDCRLTLPVCYREIVQLGNTATNYQLQPNDRIFVASRSCFDELFFWQAKKTCKRCASCNVPCQNPIGSTTGPLMIVEPAMIPPGSVSRLKTRSDPSALEPLDADFEMRSAPEKFPRDIGPANSLPLPSDRTEVDGELEFEFSE